MVVKEVVRDTLKKLQGRVDFAILQKEVMLALQKQEDVELKDLGTIPDPIKPIIVSCING
ncbi:MAG: hypothetical protein GY714_06160 [Desulfobacterales bacterium]|nr:hypothetical protein [Desulfobacterales bacterium]